MLSMGPVIQRMLNLRFAVLCATVCCSDPTGVNTRTHDRWLQAQTEASYSRPVIAGDLVIFGTGDGHLVGRRRSDGGAAWNTDVGQPVLGARLVERNGVVVASLLQSTVAVSSASGAILWYHPAPKDTIGGNTLPGQVLGNRIDADDQTAFIPAWGASVSAVDLATGAERWVWQPGRATTDTAVSSLFRSGVSGVRVSGDTVYAAVWHFLIQSGVRSEIWIVALDKRTGAELWRVTLPCYWGGACVDGAPAVYGSLVIVNQGAHEYAIDARTQRIAWDFPTTPVVTSVSESELYGDVVYHDGGDRAIYALHAATGALIWKAPISNTATSDLLITERRVLFPNGMYMEALDRATGKPVLEAQTRGGLDMPITSPAVAEAGQVFVNVFGGAWSFNEP
jgi:outer membrane protein assembly factor BamB